MADEINNGVEEEQEKEKQKETIKYFSHDNVMYLLSQLGERIKQSHMNE